MAAEDDEQHQTASHSYHDDENRPLMTGDEHADDNNLDGEELNSANAGGEQDRNATRGLAHPDAPLDDDGTLEVEDESDPPTPRFMQDENAWKRWRWVPYPVRLLGRAVAKWSLGPPNAQPYRIKPLLPAVQEYPLWLVDRFIPKRKHRFWVLFAYFSVWTITFALFQRQGTLSSEIPGWGAPHDIGCGHTYWGAGNSCGINGNACRPFTASGFPFRCPANCENFHVLEPRAVGKQEVVYAPMVIGGPSGEGQQEKAIYRGDSYICGAAIHAGVISNANGGCGVVELVGQNNGYPSTKRNGIKSVPFDSHFPLSYQFVDDVECSAEDMRWWLLSISAVFTGLLSVFTASPGLFFFGNFIGIFWTVGMALDPPPHGSTAGLFSGLLGKFLPAMFCAWVMYDKMGVRRTLGGLRAQIEKSILWLGPCWAGALDNYTFSFIPIQRLNKHDLEQQPGAKAALAIIIVVLVSIIVSQVYFFQQEGRFRKYIKLYGLLVGSVLISLLLPGLSLRIHHYILALLFLPGTSIQTRPCLVYQGLLVGFFINGIARWGFDPVLQTPGSLQGDAQKMTELPRVLPPTINWANNTDAVSTIQFNWDQPRSARFDGISILVNDVERFRSYFADRIDHQDEFVWHRNTSLDLPEYFRFAFMDGSGSGDYTKAGTWTADGEWEVMKAGPSRVKARTEQGDVLRVR